MKTMILDEGRLSKPENWRETEHGDDSFALYVDGKYIGMCELSPDGLTIISALHKVEAKRD